jgi:hypothetical protein
MHIENGSCLPEATFHFFSKWPTNKRRWKEHAGLILLHFRKIRESLVLQCGLIPGGYYRGKKQRIGI